MSHLHGKGYWEIDNLTQNSDAACSITAAAGSGNIQIIGI